MESRKQEIRRARWKALRTAGVARFPGAVGRIPNFTGAEAAAERLARERVWERARTIECNPDLPQRPVRHRALQSGKTVYMAVPRLAERRPFLELDPGRLDEKELWAASSIAGALELGRPVAPAKMTRIDLVVVGAVAAASDGARLGRGGGFADLDYGLLREVGLAGPRTPIVTTVHPSQVLRRGSIPMDVHDLSVDLVVTPARVVRCDRVFRRPRGILWDELDGMADAVPVLRGLRRR